jgi:hypothetical protein
VNARKFVEYVHANVAQYPDLAAFLTENKDNAALAIKHADKKAVGFNSEAA